MPMPASSFSIAADRIAKFVNDGFSDAAYESKVRIVVDTPVATSKLAGTTSHYINLFIYKTAPSGFQPSHNAGQRLFVRLYCLVTPFGMKLPDEPEVDLRLLGHVAQIFHDQPVISPPSAAISDYAIESIMLSPSMEELNHIWTTQGDTLPYRLSLAYEFSLIPVEASKPHVDAPHPRSASLGVSPFDPRNPDVVFNNEYTVQALARRDKKPPEADPPVTWMPMFMLVDGAKLVGNITIPATSNTIALALAGPAGEQVQVSVLWSDGTVEISDVALATHSIDAPAARHVLNITRPAVAHEATLRCTPLVTAGLAEPPYSNTLQVTFT